MGDNGWPKAEQFPQWMREVERRLTMQERRAPNSAGLTSAVTVIETTGAGGGLPARASASKTTTSLAALASDSTTNITLAKSFRLLTVQADRPCRIRLYSTPTARTNDLSRVLGARISGSDVGLILEFVCPDNAVHPLGPPLPAGASLEATPVADIAMTVQNRDTITSTVTVTFVYEAME